MKIYLALIIFLTFSVTVNAQGINPLSVYLDRSGSLLYVDFYEEGELIRLSSSGELLVNSSRSRVDSWGGQVTQVFLFGKYSYEISYSFFKLEKVIVKSSDRVLEFSYLFNQLSSIALKNSEYKIRMKYFIGDIDGVSGNIPGVSVYVDLSSEKY